MLVLNNCLPSEHLPLRDVSLLFSLQLCHCLLHFLLFHFESSSFRDVFSTLDLTHDFFLREVNVISFCIVIVYSSTEKTTCETYSITT